MNRLPFEALCVDNLLSVLEETPHLTFRNEWVYGAYPLNNVVHVHYVSLILGS